MDKSLIFCAVGNPLFYCNAYEDKDHWRWTTNSRMYETAVYQYKDFYLEPFSYDYIHRSEGYKWQIAKRFFKDYDFSKYEYIGFMDDDLITDYRSINRAIEIAREKEIKLFQLSTIKGSESTHKILHQQHNIKITTTNFVEGMGPFIHKSVIHKFIELFDYHDFKSGWGLDVILSPILKTKAGVIHEVGMFHPSRKSYYDKSEAIKEMELILKTIYPKFMKDKYDEDVGAYNEKQTEYDIFFRSI